MAHGVQAVATSSTRLTSTIQEHVVDCCWDYWVLDDVMKGTLQDVEWMKAFFSEPRVISLVYAQCMVLRFKLARMLHFLRILLRLNS